MESLELLSRRLEDIKFTTDPNNRALFPCPPSVMRYLDPTCDPNKVVGTLPGTPNQTNGRRGRLPNKEGNSESTPENQNNINTRKRSRRGPHNKLSPFNRKEQPSESHATTPHKIFYSKHLTLSEAKLGLEKGELFEATIRVNIKNSSEAYVPSPDKTKDILIYGVKARNRALDGDKVVVKILNKSEWRNPDSEDCQRTGEVVHILNQRQTVVIVGHLLVVDDKSLRNKCYTLLPKDLRLPKILVSWPLPVVLKEGSRESKDLYYGILPTSNWSCYNPPRGELKEVLGESGDIIPETRAILCSHEISENPYPDDINQYFPPPFSVEEELRHRKDFRKRCIFSIDPPTAKDLDDALSCELLPNGNYEIGIHISDVSHYVKHGTLLDKIAQELATSVYLVHRVYHMLPPALTMMASLLPGTDKLAVSIILEMAPNGTVISHSFHRSIIHSCAQLHYSHAQIFLENPEKNVWEVDEFPTVYNGFTINDCAVAVCHLHKLAAVMRKRRFDTGALAINQPKLSFEINRDTCEPLSFSLYTLHESNWLIEEFMLLANTLVANHLRKVYPDTALLRNHRPPDPVPAEKAAKILKVYGINIDFTSAGSIQKSKALYCQDEKSGNSHWDLIINNILSKPMVRAEYCVMSPGKDVSHFALNEPFYTHFTSPIRRYPDIVVHRLLISSLTDISYEEYKNPDVINEIAINSNDKKNNAKKASEASAEMYAAFLIGKLGGLEEYASVLEVKENFFEATVLSMNINLRVYVNICQLNSDLLHESSKYSVVDDKPTLTIIWDAKNNIKQTLQLFSKVKLKLMKKESCLQLRAILVRDD